MITHIEAITKNPVHLDFDSRDESTHTYESYLKRDGYKAWAIVKDKFKPADVIEEVKKAGIRGRGGAGFPAGMKWSFLPKGHQGPIYLCVNADEGEPGTFKDRVIMEMNPHQLVEGILIACYALSSKKAFVYIRGEFYLCKRRVLAAIKEVHDKGMMGDIEIVVVSGGGAYVCGEETSLLSSIEGKKGFPKNKPPFPAVKGLYREPTIINNVETIAAVPWIIRHGADTYKKIGTEKSTGTKLFSISGPIKKPGVYEVDLNYSFKKFIYEDCGGLLNGKKMKALIPGGSSTPVLLPHEIEDLKMDYESIAAAGSMLGSGGAIVLAEGTCMVKALHILIRFYAHESCGQCTPCREGLPWLASIVERIEMGKGNQGDLDELIRLCNNIEGNTICPLADAAVFPIRSFVAKFKEEFQEHINKQACPYGNKFEEIIEL